jgi:serine/threonine protein kinase
MEYADRGTLADRVRTEPLPLVVALRVTAEVARGAAELHRAGIVHRDLKPSNVLIRSTQGGPERLLIADLGVAKSLAQASGLTMSVGSAGYMAPEQSGPNSGVDVRADVYSLGAIAYRLITGEVPGLPGYVFAGGPRPDLPEPVRKVLQRTLEVNRERRWPDATTLAIQLDQLADQYSAEQQEPPSRRSGRRGRASIAAVAVLAALGAGGYGVFQWRQPVQVQAKKESISIDVPRSWNREVKPDGWEPAVLNLTKGPQPGLVVANDLGNWNILGHNINGVFVGVSQDPDLTAAVTKIDHAGCKGQPPRTYHNASWEGTIRSWDDCVGADRSVQEISLTRLSGPATPQVYVQIRQDGGTDRTDQLLKSLRVK